VSLQVRPRPWWLAEVATALLAVSYMNDKLMAQLGLGFDDGARESSFGHSAYGDTNAWEIPKNF
jgi:hypothetical protein